MQQRTLCNAEARAAGSLQIAPEQPLVRADHGNPELIAGSVTGVVISSKPTSGLRRSPQSNVASAPP